MAKVSKSIIDFDRFGFSFIILMLHQQNSVSPRHTKVHAIFVKLKLILDVVVTLMNMAPMAGTIAATKKYGFVFSLCFGEGCFAPGIPVYWVMCVL